MNQIILNYQKKDVEELEDGIINILKPEFNIISSNPVRASILHLLVEAKDVNHTMRVEEISRRIGKRHSVIIYHLEQLARWKLVDVVRNERYGDKEKRSIWGLNLRYPNLVRSVYGRILQFFYTRNELDNMCSQNKNVRMGKLS